MIERKSSKNETDYGIKGNYKWNFLVGEWFGLELLSTTCSMFPVFKSKNSLKSFASALSCRSHCMYI